MGKIIGEGITFDDVLLVTILRSHTKHGGFVHASD